MNAGSYLSRGINIAAVVLEIKYENAKAESDKDSGDDGSDKIDKNVGE